MGMTCTLPFLETLKIRDCPLLATTPRNFPSLGHLEIQGIISSQPLHNIVVGSQEVILALYLLSLAFHCVPPSLHNQTLKTLSVSKVRELTYLPLFQHTSLEKLEIRDCGKLMCLPNGLENLVSLKTLEVRGCQLLITFPDISCLNSLRELTIANCHGLTWTPIGLESCTALEILKICERDNIDYVPDLKKLSRLEDVSIYDCGDQLTSLLKVGLQSMPRLSYLVIGGCKSKLDEEPEDFPDISPLLGIKSLRALGLVCWPKLKFLPEQLQHFTALGELGINSFDGSEVPEWIGGLSSLYALGFKECWNLKYLPSRSALLRLEKLRCLQIEDCPLLKERCAKDNGPEWHKICHIELIEIDGQPI
ncbi:hypothetical protein Nepgr_033447 [Nepenthes gracilis]|uniref:R13L1/DRL21-like LRR repeat region domain-containing protein n=1 Tax=Nepenthes gracilis TaxID=150966 RepID=A0AAD3Y6X7_NEPGR|nr:hypothetical protein Nepgr_033447 [Nepenthes gracilis]